MNKSNDNFMALVIAGIAAFAVYLAASGKLAAATSGTSGGGSGYTGSTAGALASGGGGSISGSGQEQAMVTAGPPGQSSVVVASSGPTLSTGSNVFASQPANTYAPQLGTYVSPSGAGFSVAQSKLPALQAQVAPGSVPAQTVFIQPGNVYSGSATESIAPAKAAAQTLFTPSKPPFGG